MVIEKVNNYEAIITKGWFRKKQAVVYKEYYSAPWRYKVNGKYVSIWLNFRINLACFVPPENPWKPVAKLPEAKLLTSPKV